MVRLSKEQQVTMRNSILEVARKHFLENGYDNTRTKEIAKEVGIAEGTVFNYFATKADIFLEALSEGYIIQSKSLDSLNFENDICEIIFEFIYEPFSNFAKMPKRFLREVLGASITIAKKKPSIVRKLAEIDYNVISDLSILMQKLIDSKKMKDCDATVAAESIFSAVIFDAFLYVYEDEIEKETMLVNIKNKIGFILAGHIL